MRVGKHGETKDESIDYLLDMRDKLKIGVIVC